MLTFHIIVLGKLKESYWREAETEYLKRLQPFAKVVVHELKEEAFSEKNKPEEIKKREAEKIQTEIRKYGHRHEAGSRLGRENTYVVALDERGKQFSSTALSEHLNNVAMKQSSTFIFVIGGPLGLDPMLLKSVNLALSFGSLTFTHQMARVFLLEQLYRAMMIANKRRYHY